MPEKSSTMDQLGALKAKYEGTGDAPTELPPPSDLGRGGILPMSLWVGLGILLACVSAFSLVLSYARLRSLTERENAFAQKAQLLKEYDQRLSTLNSDIAEMQARQQQLKGENRVLEAEAAKGAAAAAAYRMFTTMVPELKQESEILTANIKSLKAEKTSLDGEVSSARVTRDSIQSSYTNLQANFTDTERALAAKKAELSLILAAVSTNQAVLTGLLQSVKEQQSVLAALNVDTEARRNERNDHVRVRDEAKAALPGIQDTVTRLRVEYSSLTNELTTMSSELSRLSARVSAERKTLSVLESEKSALAAEVASLEGARGEINRLLQQKESVAQEESSLSQQVKTQQAALAEATTALTALQKQVSDLDTRRLDLERAVNQLIGQQKSLSAKDSATGN
ncbi:MAG: hypothetical protein KA248_14240 [Kiritimatiellae bacterium]|nr:hypothetical protein [Kiritimatiellia bacterium]